MLAVARRRFGDRVELVEASAERAAVRRRRVRPPHVHVPAPLRRRSRGDARASSRASCGRAASSRRSSSACRAGSRGPLWELYVRAGLPARRTRAAARAGTRSATSSAARSARSGRRTRSSASSSSGARRASQDVEVRRLSLGGGVVMWGRQGVSAPPATARRGTRSRRGGWRDYVTLLHLPYTAWHLSYVVIGGCLAPVDRLGTARRRGRWRSRSRSGSAPTRSTSCSGRPLRTRIPSRVLVVLAVGLDRRGVRDRRRRRALVRALARRCSSPSGSSSSSPTTSSSSADASTRTSGSDSPGAASRSSAGTRRSPARLGVAALLAAAFAVLLSLAQRALSNHVRFVRRRVAAVDGELELRDGTPRAASTPTALIAAEERGPAAARRGVGRARGRPGRVPALESAWRVRPSPGSSSRRSSPRSLLSVVLVARAPPLARSRGTHRASSSPRRAARSAPQPRRSPRRRPSSSASRSHALTPTRSRRTSPRSAGSPTSGAASSPSASASSRSGMAELVAAVEQRVEERLRAWEADLERAQNALQGAVADARAAPAAAHRGRRGQGRGRGRRSSTRRSTSSAQPRSGCARSSRRARGTRSRRRSRSSSRRPTTAAARSTR